MQQTDNVFSYIYARKTPTITYKRKQQTYSDAFSRPLTPVTSISVSPPPSVNTLQSTQQHTTDLTPVSTDDEKENMEIQHIEPQQPTLHTIDLDFTPTSAKDIFDLSDDDNNDTQVEIRVASSLHSNNKVKNKPANSNNHLKTMNKKLPKTPSKPSACHHQKRDIKQTSTKPSFARALSAPSPVTTTAQPIARNASMLPRLPDTKRRKRNLVSQLKAANGERPDFSTQHGGNRFYVTASDNDDDVDHVSMFDSFNNNNDHVPAERPHNLAPILTPSASSQILSMESNDYNDRMEQELAELMRTEFGQDSVDDIPSTILTPSSSQQGRYVPENTIRAPVTYKRLNNKSTTTISSNEPLTGLDQEMEQQIQYILSNDF